MRDKGLSVYKASRLYQVPESTLRDRTRVKVDVDAKVGKETIFVKWAKCDFCDHWTHLTFCSQVKILRRDSVFRCPHC